MSTVFTRLIVLFACISITANTSASVEYLLPKPQKISLKSSDATFSPKSIRIESKYHLKEVQNLCLEHGLRISGNSNSILRLSLVERLTQVPLNNSEAYRLDISQNAVLIEAETDVGLLRGLQTLDQLLSSRAKGKGLRELEIVDWPAFEVRGVMHDVGRTFIPLKELKKQIALFARYKINYFHWHLTENQAWRLESKLYPQLNSPASMTRFLGEYYTLEEARELTEYCRQKGITLIPELDMPGHSAAFERAMGFGMQTPQGKAVLKDLLREACSAMDVPYIHIGTDEVEFIDKTFVPEMVAFVRSLGRKVISWNPGWHYKEGEIDLLQLWSYRGKTIGKTPSIDCRLHYINHYDLFADIQMLYSSRIYNVPQGNKTHLGSIIAFWNDRYISDYKSNVAQNVLYPSVLALAERSWMGGGVGYFNAPTAALSPEASISTRDAFVDFERRMLWHKERYFKGEPFPYVKQSHAVWQLSKVFDNRGILSEAFAPEADYLSASKLGHFSPPDTLSIKEYPKTLWGSGVYLRHVWGDLCYGAIPHARENSTVYARTWVHSPKRQAVGLLFETQNYSRSEKDIAPPTGSWDYKESKLWLNGHLIPPPNWTATHTDLSNEIPLGNENATARPPLKVILNKGWNSILVKLPIGKFYLPEIRLNKWMFTASFVTLDGYRAFPDLKYATPVIGD